MKLKLNSAFAFVFAVFIFVVSVLPAGQFEKQEERFGFISGTDQCQYQEYTSYQEHQLFENKIFEVRTQTWQIRQVKNIQRLFLLLCAAGAFSYCVYNKRMFLVCIQSHTYLMARFLCELFTLKKKDGKKRSLFLINRLIIE